ncbi:MAG: hypothetical protein AABW51_01475 [Nanoarchaeota archaeon]
MEEFCLKRFDGSKCPVDLENPLIMVKGCDFGKNYERGSMVYPIGNSGKRPGQHDSEGWMTISTLNTDTANFCGVEIGKTAVPLKEMIQSSGKYLGINYDGKSFTRNDKNIDSKVAIEELLDYYTKMKIPEAFRDSSDLSKIVSSEKTQYERGIIFEKLENLAAALIMYDMGIINSSTATIDRLYSDMWGAAHKNAGVDDPSIFKNTTEGKLISLGELMARANGRIVKGLVQEILDSKGKYSRHFDYDGMGSAFFKTSVGVEKVNDKYLLELSAAYVGDEPERELAKILERERGLVRVGSTYKLTDLAPGWMGVNIEKIMQNGILVPEQVNILAKVVAGELKSDKVSQIKLDNMELNLDFGVGQEENYRPDISRTKDNKLFMKLKGEGKPYLSFSLSPVKKSRIVDSQERVKITKLRDELSELVQRNW